MATIAQPLTPSNPTRYYAVYGGTLEGVATVQADGRLLFTADGAHEGQGALTLDAADPELHLAGCCALADAQRAADEDAGLLHPWAKAVQAVATRAKASLGEASYTRIEKAFQIVLEGGVHLNDDQSAVVESQSEPLKGYAVNGVCPCPDFQRAPAHLCKHRLAARMMRRALELAEPPSTTQPSGQPLDFAAPPQAERQEAAQACTLPEAPASVNVRVMIQGRDCQITLRDTDEARLLQRLAAVLAQYPTAPSQSEASNTAIAPPAADPMPTCALHGAVLRQQHKGLESWWSHKTIDGRWCKGY